MPKPVLALDGVYVLLVVKEALVGLALGLLAAILMAAMQIAGGLIDFQIGFAIANVIDPQTGAQSPLLGEYLHLLALLLLLALDGHHLLLDGMFYSYHWLPLDRLPHVADGRAVEYAVRAFAAMFAAAFQMAAPLVGSLVFSRRGAWHHRPSGAANEQFLRSAFSAKTAAAFLLLLAEIRGDIARGARCISLHVCLVARVDAAVGGRIRWASGASICNFSLGKTEKATPRKRQEVREKGQVAKSGDVVSASVLLASFLALSLAGAYERDGLLRLFARALSDYASASLTVDSLHRLFLDWLSHASLLLAPLFAAAVLAAGLANVFANRRLVHR